MSLVTCEEHQLAAQATIDALRWSAMRAWDHRALVLEKLGVLKEALFRR